MYGSHRYSSGHRRSGHRRNPEITVINERTVLDAILANMPPAAAQQIEAILGRDNMLKVVEDLLIQRLRVKVAQIREQMVRGS